MNIGLCDDEKLVLDALEKLVRKCCEEKSMDVCIYQFLSGEELLK